MKLWFKGHHKSCSATGARRENGLFMKSHKSTHFFGNIKLLLRPLRTLRRIPGFPSSLFNKNEVSILVCDMCRQIEIIMDKMSWRVPELGMKNRCVFRSLRSEAYFSCTRAESFAIPIEVSCCWITLALLFEKSIARYLDSHWPSLFPRYLSRSRSSSTPVPSSLLQIATRYVDPGEVSSFRWAWHAVLLNIVSCWI